MAVAVCGSGEHVSVTVPASGEEGLSLDSYTSVLMEICKEIQYYHTERGQSSD